MLLAVTGLDEATIKFEHLFGRYIKGFRPWTHCDRCLDAQHATAVSPRMTDGEIVLEDRLFYLCGVGQRLTKQEEIDHPEMAKKQTNVHLAVIPRKGSVAATGSVYGVTFTIQNAQAIPIEIPSKPMPNLSGPHFKCKNFQFGYQIFEVGDVSETPGEVVHTLRENWKNVPGMILNR